MTEDNTIIAQCLAGHGGRFEVLVRRYQPRLMALALNILGDPDEALDAVQEAFTQAFTNLDRFDINRDFKNWLMGIGVKRSLDRIRKRRSFLKFFQNYSRETDTYESFKNHGIEDSVLFRQHMKLLRPKERTALSLKINEGCTAREIGEVLGCHENTAYVHLFNAKKKIKKAFQLSQAEEMKRPSKNREVKP